VRDNAVRRILKGAALARFVFDVGVHRAVARLRGRAHFVLGGDCRSCGACCEAPAIQVSRLTWYFPTLRALFLWWQRRVNGFELVTDDFRRRVFTFTCTHFDLATRRCDSYDSRPGMCRDYPRALLYQPHPELLPSCGHRPVARGAKRFLRVLDGQALTEEQRQRLKKDLFLE
jgi:hypothetical protein